MLRWRRLPIDVPLYSEQLRCLVPLIDSEDCMSINKPFFLVAFTYDKSLMVAKSVMFVNDDSRCVVFQV